MKNKQRQHYQRIAAILSETRKNKAIRLKEIAQKTKVSPEFLQKLESGEFDFLPQLYVKAFLRSFAGALDLEADALVREYEAAQKADQTEAGADSDLPAREQEEKKEAIALRDIYEKIKSPLGRKIAFILAAFLLFFVFTVLIWPQNKDLITEPASKKIEIPRFTESAADSVSENVVPVKSSNSLVTLIASATDCTWLRIVYNDSISEEHLFLPGNKKVWEGHEFYLKIGNCPGLDLNLNGKELFYNEPSRRVRTIRVNAEGVESIATARFPG